MNAKLWYVNPNEDTFIILRKTTCFKQNKGEKILQKINKCVYLGDLHDGVIVLKQDNKHYIDLGYNSKLGCTIFIPIIIENGSETNVERYTFYINNKR